MIMINFLKLVTKVLLTIKEIQVKNIVIVNQNKIKINIFINKKK